MAPRNVLVIDDDPLFCVIAEETLLALGADEVAVAEDGAQGLQMVSDRPEAFDLILCDLNMPNIDGVLVLRELGKRNYSGALIIVSSEKQAVIESVHAMARLAGVHMLGALKKPLNASTLQQLLASETREPSAQSIEISRDEVRAALDAKAIVPVYQPKLDLIKGEINSVEVLARYAQPGAGLHIVDALADPFACLGLSAAIVGDLDHQAVAIRFEPYHDSVRGSMADRIVDRFLGNTEERYADGRLQLFQRAVRFVLEIPFGAGARIPRGAVQMVLNRLGKAEKLEDGRLCLLDNLPQVLHAMLKGPGDGFQRLRRHLGGT